MLIKDGITYGGGVAMESTENEHPNMNGKLTPVIVDANVAVVDIHFDLSEVSLSQSVEKEKEKGKK